MKAIFSLYFVTRLLNLLILPFFTDESSYVYTSVVMKGNILNNWDLTLNLPVVKPPLFFLMTIVFEGITSNPILAGRLVSVFFGAWTLLGVYLLTKHFFDNKTASLAAILYILSPFTLTYDRLALMDSAMTAFSVWILLMAVKFIKKNKIIYLQILVFLLLFSLLTKQSGKFFLLMLPVIPVFYKDYRKVFTFGLVSALSYSIYYLFMSQSQYFDFYSNFDKTYFNISPEAFINNLRAVFSWVKSYFPVMFIFIPFGFIYVLLTNLKKGLVIFFWAFAPVTISVLVGQYFFPRYLLPSIVFIMPILALLIKRYYVLFLAIIPCLIFDYYILTEPDKAPYHYNERSQLISGWPAGYGVKEAFYQLSSLDPKSKILIEGDNGHLYSSLSLLNPDFSFNAIKQNILTEEILKMERSDFDYLLTNRENDIIDENFLPLWKYQKPRNGVFLILYEVR